MFIAYTVVAIVVGLALIGSAQAKIRQDKFVTGTLTGVGVPVRAFVPLGVLQIAGGIGLLIGIGWRPLGIAAAIGVILYFAGAIGFHIRAKDFKGIAMPAVFLAAAVVALVLGLASA